MSHEPSRARFAATRWSLVQRAAGGASRAALDELCVAYWRPLYAWLRRDGHDPELAADLCQGFLTSLLDGAALAVPREGRFRGYLLGALRHFVSDQRRRESAQRRGGDRQQVEAAAGEQLLVHLQGRELSPEQAFERAFAVELLGRALARLQAEFVQRGQGERFAALRPLLDGRGDQADSGGYAAVAEQLGLAEGALRVAVHRARQRLGDLVRAEIAEVVESPDQVDTELAHLREVLGAS
jgi:RNA polymerase sigma-70 factor (ECF subfamily)